VAKSNFPRKTFGTVWISYDHSTRTHDRDETAASQEPILRYNAAIMRYERSSNMYLCIGVRGFDREGFLESRLLPG